MAKWTTFLRFGAAFCSLSVACACSSERGDSVAPGLTVVGPLGSSLTLPDDARLNIPKGALMKATGIGFRTVAPSSLPDLPASMRAVSAIYEVTPHGLQLEQSVELTIPHRAMRPERVDVIRLDDDADNDWERIAASIAVSVDTVSFEIDHFSYYLVVEDSNLAGSSDASMPSDSGAPPVTPSTGGTMTGAGTPAERDDAGLPDAGPPNPGTGGSASLPDAGPPNPGTGGSASLPDAGPPNPGTGGSASVPDAGPTDAGPVATGGTTSACAPGSSPTGTCASLTNGIYAFKSRLEVWWDPPLDAFGAPSVTTNPGRGNLDAVMLVTVSDMCQQLDGSGAGYSYIEYCGLDLPEFTSDLACDAYDLSVSPVAWDSPNMPTIWSAAITTGFEPGDRLDIAPQSALLGIDLDSPQATWPQTVDASNPQCHGGADTGVQCLPDHDNDGQPGIAMQPDTSGANSPSAPLACGVTSQPYARRGLPSSADAVLLSGGPRVDQLQVALRPRIGGGGTVDAACTAGQGPVSAIGVDLLLADCSLDNGQACSPSNRDFVAQYVLPRFRGLQQGEVPAWIATSPAWAVANKAPSQGPISSFVRLGNLGDVVSCDQARRTSFPF